MARGEAAPIDTVKAQLEVQRRTVQRYEAEQAYYGRRSTWATTSGRRAARRHLDVRKVVGRVDQAEAQRLCSSRSRRSRSRSCRSAWWWRLTSSACASMTLGGIDRDNDVLGSTVKSPLRFMKARARRAIADQRLDQQRLELARVRRGVELNVREAVFALSVTHAVLELPRQAVRQSRQLLAGEQRRFENGESQLLVVNLRERAALAVALGESAVVPEDATR